ncbi:MAG: BamA/TamA family outer membrane protein [Nonlabens sp.]
MASHRFNNIIYNTEPKAINLQELRVGKSQRSVLLRAVSLLLLILCISSCAVKKYIPDDELLFVGSNLEVQPDSAVVVKDVKALTAQLKSVLRPKPNSKLLRLRPGLHYHYKVEKDSAGFIARWLNKKIGEEPVYLSDVEEENTRDLLRNRLENRGFYYSRITSSVDRDTAAQEGEVNYKIILPQPYVMKTYQVDRDSIPFYRVLEELAQESPFEIGQRFDLSAMKLERQRLDQELKNLGYYYFNDRFLIFQADTNQYDNRKFDLYLKLKKDVPSKAVKPYRIRNVDVYPNNSIPVDTIARDTTLLNGKRYIQEGQFFKPKYLEDYIQIDSGDLYNPNKSKSTARRLGTIGAYKYVNIEYTDVDSIQTDSVNYLDAKIYLSPLKKRSIRAEVQGVTKSNDFTGPNLGVTFANRNLFHGGETLNINAQVGYEVQVASGDQRGLTSTEFKLGADLIWPRMLSPIKFDKNYFEYDIPKTIAGVEVDYLSRSQLYSLLTFSGRFGYVWRANKYVTHEINPISINYVNLLNSSDEFDQILMENEFLRTSFEKEFISGLTYSFTYNGMLHQDRKHVFYLNSTFDTAGNSISLLGQENELGQSEFLGLRYAQYAKLDADFRYHYRITQETKLATRLFAGYGLPYGNSDVLPFSKQYFSGGAYSVRAFRIRGLGPGSYRPDVADTRSFFDQSGNVRLEANIEYRFPMLPYVNGAVFADAGNVWTTGNAGFEDGRFGSDFINEFGIGVGVGARVDIQGFVIRFDLAAPMHDPQELEGERWVYDFGSPVFNFAIGYPF